MKVSKIISLLFLYLIANCNVLFAQTEYTLTEGGCGYNSVSPTTSVSDAYIPGDVVAGKTTTTPGVKIVWEHPDGGDPFWNIPANQEGIKSCEARVQTIIENALASPKASYHIRIRVVFNDLVGGETSGRPAETRINFASNVGTGSYSNDIHYPYSLANFIKCKSQGASGRVYGSGTTAGSCDMEIHVNTIVGEFEDKWYFDWYNSCPLDKYDYATMLLHEVVHGLGYCGFIKQSGTTASFNTGKLSIYDNWLEDDKTGTNETVSGCNERTYVWNMRSNTSKVYGICIGAGNYWDNAACNAGSNNLYIPSLAQVFLTCA